MVGKEYFLCRSNDVFLSVKVFGKGKKNVLAFHGYGQDAEVYKLLANDQTDITLYSFDLFCHGSSAFPENESPVTHNELKKLLEDFLQTTGIKSFQLIGFSMGGKYALSIAYNFPRMVSDLILVAPDGIKKDFWYQFATQLSLLRVVFKSVIDHPNFFNQTAKLLDWLNLVDGRVRKFAVNEMNTREKRSKVYFSWVYHRKLFTNIPELAALINSYSINVYFVLGKYDRIITPAYIVPLQKLLKNYHMRELKCGHTRLLQKFVLEYDHLIT